LRSLKRPAALRAPPADERPGAASRACWVKRLAPLLLVGVARHWCSRAPRPTISRSANGSSDHP